MNDLTRKIQFLFFFLILLSVVFLVVNYASKILISDYLMMAFAGCSAITFILLQREKDRIVFNIQQLVLWGGAFLLFSLLHWTFATENSFLDCGMIALGVGLTYESFAYQQQKTKAGLLVAFLYGCCMLELVLRSSMPRVEVVRCIIYACCSVNLVLLSISIFPGNLFGRMVGNLLLAVIFLYFAICFIYYYLYGVFFNCDTLIAILQSNFNEASEFVASHCSLVMQLICIGIIVIYVVAAQWVLDIRLQSIRSKTFRVFIGSLILANISIAYRCRYNAFVYPYIHLANFIRTSREYNEGVAVRKAGLAALFTGNEIGKGVYVLVIGESHNRKHMSTYGYCRTTSPWLDRMKQSRTGIIFNDVYACYSQTALVMPYFLTAKNQYNDYLLKDCPSLVEIANAAGFETVWISNQWKYGAGDASYSVIAQGAKEQFWNYENNKSQYDESLIEYLDDVRYSDKMLIIFNLVGSHFLYQNRYPESESVWKQENIIDRYDNSVRYNDNVMQKLYERCRKIPYFKALVYCSDHGEDVDGGLRHGSVEKCNSAMIEIPMYVIVSDEYYAEAPDKVERLKNAANTRMTNDLMFNMMMSIMGLKIDRFYEAENDILNEQYDGRPERFRTLHGKKKIEELND